MKSLAYCSVLAALAVGCDVRQDLGETASGSSGGGSGGGSGDSSGPGTSEGTGTASETMGTTGGSGETGTLETGPSGGTESGSDSSSGETGEPPGTCGTDATFVRWDPSNLNTAALGVNETFIGVGDCTISVDDLPGDEVTLELGCTLDGARDGVDFEGEAFDLDVLLETNAVLPSFEPTVVAQIHIGGSGFELGGDRYIVLSQPMLANDADAPVLIATQGANIDPIGAQVDPWLPFSWYRGPSFAPSDAFCETGDAPRCGFDVAVEGGWLDEAPIAVPGGQVESFGAPTEAGIYDLYVETAWQAPDSFKCGEDFPTSSYAFVALGQTP